MALATHSERVLRPNLKTRRNVLQDLRFKLLLVLERLVAQVDIALQRERELAMCEKPTGRLVVLVQPLVDGRERVKSVVECSEGFGGGAIDVHCVRSHGR